MNMAEVLPSAPEGLSARSQSFWAQIPERYDLETHHLELLRQIVQVIPRGGGCGRPRSVSRLRGAPSWPRTRR